MKQGAVYECDVVVEEALRADKDALEVEQVAAELQRPWHPPAIPHSPIVLDRGGREDGARGKGGRGGGRGEEE